jgi:mono/diheme cytochrome c family protein
MLRRCLVAAAFALGASRTLAQAPAAPLSPFQRAKAETLLERKLSCLGCHTLNGKGGRVGPDLTAVGARLDAAAIRKQIEQPRALMPRLPIAPSTRDLIVAYLSEQRASSAAPAQTIALPAGSGSRAEQLYQQRCASCHGAAGKGDGPNAQYLDRPPARHSDAAAMRVRTDDRLFDAIHAGGAIMGGSARMPAFGETLSAEEIRLLVSYIRQLCRCQQPAWADGAR